MARVTQWRRAQAPGVSALHDAQTTLCTLDPGETISRVRLHFEVSSLNANEYVWAGVPVLWGVFLITRPAGPALDLFTDATNEGWMWWEGISFRTQPAQGLAGAKYVDQGPDGGGYRDIRAQRKADPTHGSFVVFRITGSPLVPAQTFFTQVTSSCLVTLP